MKKIKRVATLLLAIVFMVLPSAVSSFAHAVEFVVLGGAEVRFQYAGGQPMSNAEIHVLDENMEIIAIRYANEYGVFDYGAYFGTAARLKAHHNNFIVRFIIPDTFPRVVYNDRGERVEVVVPAGSGGRLSTASMAFIYIGAVSVIGYAALLVIRKKQTRKPDFTVAEAAIKRRIPRNFST